MVNGVDWVDSSTQSGTSTSSFESYASSIGLTARSESEMNELIRKSIKYNNVMKSAEAVKSELSSMSSYISQAKEEINGNLRPKIKTVKSNLKDALSLINANNYTTNSSEGNCESVSETIESVEHWSKGYKIKESYLSELSGKIPTLQTFLSSEYSRAKTCLANIKRQMDGSAVLISESKSIIDNDSSETFYLYTYTYTRYYTS